MTKEVCFKNKCAIIDHKVLIADSLRWILLPINLMLSHNNKVGEGS